MPSSKTLFLPLKDIKPILPSPQRIPFRRPSLHLPLQFLVPTVSHRQGDHGVEDGFVREGRMGGREGGERGEEEGLVEHFGDGWDFGEEGLD